MMIQVGKTAKVVTVSGGNLFDIAAQEYGDHTLWNIIARANNLISPFIAGVVELTIPDKPVDTRQNTGVIGA